MIQQKELTQEEKRAKKHWLHFCTIFISMCVVAGYALTVFLLRHPIAWCLRPLHLTEDVLGTVFGFSIVLVWGVSAWIVYVKFKKW